jgi:hypothetical protein
MLGTRQRDVDSIGALNEFTYGENLMLVDGVGTAYLQEPYRTMTLFE